MQIVQILPALAVPAAAAVHCEAGAASLQPEGYLQTGEVASAQVRYSPQVQIQKLFEDCGLVVRPSGCQCVLLEAALSLDNPS